MNDTADYLFAKNRRNRGILKDRSVSSLPSMSSSVELWSSPLDAVTFKEARFPTKSQDKSNLIAHSERFMRASQQLIEQNNEIIDRLAQRLENQDFSEGSIPANIAEILAQRRESKNSLKRNISGLFIEEDENDTKEISFDSNPFVRSEKGSLSCSSPEQCISKEGTTEPTDKRPKKSKKTSGLAREVSDNSLASKESTAAQKVETRGRKKKVQGMPNRPLSAYNFFFQEERKKILAEEGSCTIGYKEMARVVSQRWKSLSEEEVKPHKEKAAGDLVRYKNAMSIFYKNHPEAVVAAKTA